ncbi:hypothetical protein GB931_18155 [Modestobacter sp. I12A-02628]|uniref:GerMN domain-containing protein n=1 Tax=Goekera deserti TaxID=2497753 RepID=A0A7K3W9P6_9ACTN|nr:LpqB family beta-propeller domain-containing protein [Goekera deserti]MPQ99805.1 hypothetical protein [Goekera deserti]NDI49962.1 hypothetical protein [Goekera deserti]NEL52560.1 hypothetical protein [Goekera deserti]
MARTVLGALAVAALLAGCSTVPSESATVQITQVAEAPDPAVGIEALGPQPGASPEDVVRGFLDASGSPTRGHPVARQFLTPEAAGQWDDTASTTIIGSVYAAVPTGTGRVELTADLVGAVDERGTFTVAAREQLSRDLTLDQVDGQWRISDPPEGLVILEPDFTRTYSQVDAFFLDPTGNRLVPDPVFLLNGASQPTSLVERMLDGPSPTLAAGVTNALAGASLRNNVSLSGQTATVDLTGVDTTSPGRLADLSAQLVWSLDQLDRLDLATIRSVRVLVDGEPAPLTDVPEVQTVDDWAGLDPDAAPVDSVGHYLVDGALRTVDGAPAPGPAGTGAYRLTSAAVSADARTGALTTTVGVGGGPVPSLLTGPYGGDLASVLMGSSFTPPTTAATRQEAWTVRDGTEVIRLPVGGSPQVVDATTLPGLGTTTSFQLSPDGVRAAAVVAGPAGPELVVGTVVRTDSAVALRDLRQVAPSLDGVSAVAWRNASTLLVLAAEGAPDRTAPWSVGVDGWDPAEITLAGLPSQPTQVAAAPSRQPLVTAGGSVWRLSGGRWVALLSDAAPLPGGAPFYPL